MGYSTEKSATRIMSSDKKLGLASRKDVKLHGWQMVSVSR
jgi:hypothetical protein